MSLWLPRTSPTLLVRTYCRSQLPIHSISTLVLHGHPTSQAPIVVPSCRLLNSKASPGHSPEDKRDVPMDSAPSGETKALPLAPKEPKKTPLITRAWKKVKHEAAHYWHGSKLLVSEVRISARLQWKILHGESLTRRERRQVRLGILL